LSPGSGHGSVKKVEKYKKHASLQAVFPMTGELSTHNLLLTKYKRRNKGETQIPENHSFLPQKSTNLRVLGDF
jgi:hypothetical protein